MVIINFAGKNGVSSSPDKVSFTLKGFNGDNMIRLRCRKTVDMGSLVGLYAIYTGTKCEELRLVYNSIQLEEQETVGSAGIAEGGVIFVFHVVTVIDHVNVEQWICA